MYHSGRNKLYCPSGYSPLQHVPARIYLLRKRNFPPSKLIINVLNFLLRDFIYSPTDDCSFIIVTWSLKVFERDVVNYRLSFGHLINKKLFFYWGKVNRA